MKDTFEQIEQQVLPEAHVGEAGNGALDLAALRFFHPRFHGKYMMDKMIRYR